jgi:hypothetical protein
VILLKVRLERGNFIRAKETIEKRKPLDKGRFFRLPVKIRLFCGILFPFSVLFGKLGLVVLFFDQISTAGGAPEG